MMMLLIFVCVIVQLSYAQLDKQDLVPDVLNKYPESILEVTYKGNVQVQEGNELTPTMVQDPPTVKWNADANSFYLIIMIDPDPPKRINPTLREWLHWIVGNIPGCDMSKGEVLAEYVGAGPPRGAGLHRYVQLLFKQPGKIDFSNRAKLNNTSDLGRSHFCSRGFAKEYNLGEPIAVNLFQAQFDDYVLKLYEKLNSKMIIFDD